MAPYLISNLGSIAALVIVPMYGYKYTFHVNNIIKVNNFIIYVHDKHSNLLETIKLSCALYN